MSARAGAVLAAMLAGALAGMLAGGAALAEAPADVAALESCLAAGAAGTRCIGLIRTPCTAAPGGETTVGLVECAARETAAWDAILNRSYKDLRAGEAEPARTALRDAQRAWIAWRDADCRYAAAQYAGGSLARVTAALCLMDRTAERVLHLRAFSQGGN